MWRRKSCSCQKLGNHPWHLPFSCPPESNQLPNCVIYHLNISVSLHLHYCYMSCHPPPSSSGTSSSLSFPWTTIITSLTVFLYHIHLHFHLTCHPSKLYFNIWSKRAFKNANMTWKFSILKHISSSKILKKSRILQSFRRSACLCNSFFSSHIGVSDPWTNLWNSFMPENCVHAISSTTPLSQPLLLLMNFSLSLMFHPKYHFLGKASALPLPVPHYMFSYSQCFPFGGLEHSLQL